MSKKVEKYGALSKKTYNKCLFQSMAAQLTRYPGSGNFAMNFPRISMPAMVEVYGDQPDKIVEKQMRYLNEYFNTESTAGELLYGAMIGIEASGEEDATDISDALKVSLMGPLAGIGDSIFKVGIKVIFAAMAGYMALEGSVVGLALCIVVNYIVTACMVGLFKMGYTQGTNFINTMKDQLNLVTSTISIMGLIVIGNCIPSTVKLTTKLVLSYGESIKPVQEILDSIFPYLLPCVATYLMYRALEIKGMTTTKLIWIVIGVFVALSAVGIF